jgi:dihydroorotase
VEHYDTNFKMMPPLKNDEDIEGLFGGIADGTVDAIASDHAPHHLDSKQVEFSRATVGILGLQTSLPLFVELVSRGKVSATRMVDLLCAGPAKAFGIASGTLGVGRDADVTILDPKRRWHFDEQGIRSRSKNSPFVGRELVGQVVHVLVGGQRVVRDSKLVSDMEAEAERGRSV